jgi:hypothetical protein
MYNKQNNFRKDKFSRARGWGGGGGGGFFSSIKNSLRAKFKSLKRILSSWARNLLCFINGPNIRKFTPF